MANNIQKKDMPLGVKIIAILIYIGAVFDILFAILMFFGASYLATMIPNLNNVVGFGLGAITASIGVLFLLFAVLNFFIGRGLWKGQQWSRIVVLVFASIGVFFGIIAFVSGEFSSIIGMLINGFIVYYFGFAEEVKKAFV